MKDEFEKYLLSIGIEELFLKRSEEVISFYEENVINKIDAIFVTDYIDGEGRRNYDNMWLFTDTFAMEAKQFLAKYNFDITPFSKRIKYLSIQKTKYDFKKAGPESRMTIECVLDLRELGLSFKSSGTNCDFLRDIYKKFLKPNLCV